MPEYSAVLPCPPGLNHSYRAGSGRRGSHTRVYMSDKASQWAADAFLLLRAAGFKPLPPRRWKLTLSCVLFTQRMDLDAPLKLTIDVVADALAIDDEALEELHVVKRVASTPADRRIELHVSIEPRPDPDFPSSMAG